MTETDITPSVLLTGPTSGIGARMLHELAARRRTLVLLGRPGAALDRAVAAARTAGASAHGVGVDLADLRQVSAAAARVRVLVAAGALPPPGAVILNAGAQFTDRRRSSAQGHELTFAVNVVAQDVLLRGVEPVLAPSAHVVLLGSSTHRGRRASFGLVPDPEWDDPARMAEPDPPAAGRAAPDRERGGVAYATSKLALVTASHDWADRLAGGGRRLTCYDPGLVPGTGLGKDMPAYRYWVWRRLMPAMSVLPGATTPARTARHAVSLALGETHPQLHDGYVEMGRVTAAEAITFDVERRRALSAWLDAAAAAVVP